MDKEWFDIYWKIALIIALIIGMAFVYIEFRKISIAGRQCIENPLVYGAKIMEKKNTYTYSYETTIGENYFNCICTLTKELWVAK